MNSSCYFISRVCGPVLEIVLRPTKAQLPVNIYSAILAMLILQLDLSYGVLAQILKKLVEKKTLKTVLKRFNVWDLHEA